MGNSQSPLALPIKSDELSSPLYQGRALSLGLQELGTMSSHIRLTTS